MNEQELAEIIASPPVHGVSPLVEAIRQLVRDRDYWREQAFDQQDKRFAFVSKSFDQLVSMAPDATMQHVQAIRDELDEIVRLFHKHKKQTCQLSFPAQSPTSPADASAPVDAQRAVQDQENVS
jgi:hypothetical protein